MTREEALKLKAGDKVRLISKGKLKMETDNWIKHPQESPTKIGDVFYIRQIIVDSAGTWFRLSRLGLAHPCEKFEKVK